MGLLSIFKRKPATTPIRRTVKVMPRETLRTIAEREYGDQDKWELILARNKWRFEGGDPAAIYPGMDLDIPELETR